MGQALCSETHSIPGGDGYKYWVGLKMKAFRGHKKTIYNGILLGSGPRWGENVVVKSFTNIPGTKDNWRYEVVKADITRQMIAMYKNSCQDNSDVRVVSVSIVQMDKVSKVNKWLDDRKGKSTIGQDDWVSVEEYVPGEFRRFSPWTNLHGKRIKREADHLQVFSHFTFMKSQGTFVVCDFQGTIKEEDGKVLFTLTDSIVHSLRKEYGPFDEGVYGINEFFKMHKCNRVCREWPIPQPETPPPPFSSLPLTPPPAFEDIVLPVPRTPVGLLEPNDPWRRSNSVRIPRIRHTTGDSPKTSPNMRTSHTTSNMNSFYNDTISSRDRSFSAACQSQIQRSRFHSERGTNLPLLVIPSAPPDYEDCVQVQVEFS